MKKFFFTAAVIIAAVAGITCYNNDNGFYVGFAPAFTDYSYEWDAQSFLCDSFPYQTLE